MLTKRQLEDAAKCKSNETCMTCKVWKIEYDGMFDCIERLAKTAIAYREMLERLEWVDNDYCPICGQYKANGHANDCELAAFLGGLEMAQKGIVA